MEQNWYNFVHNNGDMRTRTGIQDKNSGHIRGPMKAPFYSNM
jgi:hypothetical protein